MTIFNTVQFPAFDGVSKSTQPAAPQLSLPADEAIQVFQQAYERPSELPQPVERPAELPPATPETLAKVVAENLTLAKELPQPVELPVRGRDVPVASKEVESVLVPTLTKERPAELPPATPETLAKVVAENLALAKELPQPVELPARGRDVPAASKEVESVLVPTLTGERPAELPPATPETLAKVVEENLALAKELPQPYRVGEGADATVASVVERPQPYRVGEDADETVASVAGAVPAVAPTVTASEAAPVDGVAAKVSADAPRTASSVVVEAASAVADTLLVTPSLMHGGGEIRVQLKPDVLDGAQICIKVIGKSMQVEFASVTDDVARLMTEAQPQLIQRLAEKMPTFEVAVTVLPGNVTARRLARKGVGRSGGEA